MLLFTAQENERHFDAQWIALKIKDLRSMRFDWTLLSSRNFLTTNGFDKLWRPWPGPTSN